MSYVLTNDSLAGSAKILADALMCNVRYTPTTEPPTIRWGNSIGDFGTRDTKFNSPQAIALCGSKLRLSNFLVDRHFPTLTFSKGVPTKYPICLRTTLTGHGGEGIIIIENEDQFRFNPRNLESWWSPWHNFNSELGVHVLGGNIARIFKKVWQDEAQEESPFPIRNSERGYRFSLRSPETYPRIGELQTFVKNLFRLVNVNMARLDVGWDSATKEFVLIEINTAPALTANVHTAEAYVRYVTEQLR